MATAAEHQEKADRHLRFLNQISDEFPDWLAVVAFYAAVELVEKLLARHDYHSKDHFDRRTALKPHHPNRQLNHAYADLYNASMNARYLSLSECPTAEYVRETLIGRHLQRISQYVASHA